MGEQARLGTGTILAFCAAIATPIGGFAGWGAGYLRTEGEQKRMMKEIEETKTIAIGEIETARNNSVTAVKDAESSSITEINSRKPFPVGAIVAWQKNQQKRDGSVLDLELPDGWVECTWQDSGTPEYVKNGPLVGAKIPNLNGEGRFLRGGDASGIPQDATTISTAAGCGYLAFPTIQDNDGTVRFTSGETRIHLPKIGTEILDNPALDCFEAGPGGRNGQKVRPVNVSVVWIMRVK